MDTHVRDVSPTSTDRLYLGQRGIPPDEGVDRSIELEPASKMRPGVTGRIGHRRRVGPRAGGSPDGKAACLTARPPRRGPIKDM